MKSKLAIIGFMILSLLAISANAQIKTVQQVILQDDKSGDHLIFVLNDGEYKFESCTENFATSGVGKEGGIQAGPKRYYRFKNVEEF